ncbi:hypothetical protein ACOMHN_009227 [Nucella lapillus]
MAANSLEDAGSYERVANDVFVYGSVSLALAMAKETGLVHCLCTAHGPLTAQHMASQLKLKERYVPGGGDRGKEGAEARYWVPPTCRQTLQKAGVNTIMIASSVRHYAGVSKCIALDGPDSVDTGEESEESASEGFDALDDWALAHLAPITEKVLETPGLKQQLERGLRALEVGCGTGRLFLHLAAMFPNSHFTLTDLEPQAVQLARQHAEEKRLTNVDFQILDILNLPEDLKESFDWLLTAYVLHDLPHPLKGLRGVCKALKPGGHFSLVDMIVSSYVAENVKHWKVAAALYSMSTFNCIPESCRQSDTSQAPGACLGAEQAAELVEAAGMKVLGMGRSEALSFTAVCMCQKPE